jgi:hypothetical protein
LIKDKTYFPLICDPRIIVEIEDMSYFLSIYDPRIIVEIEDMSYFLLIYDPRIIVGIEDMSYFPSIYDPTFGLFTTTFLEFYTKMVGRHESKIVGFAPAATFLSHRDWMQCCLKFNSKNEEESYKNLLTMGMFNVTIE